MNAIRLAMEILRIRPRDMYLGRPWVSYRVRILKRDGYQCTRRKGLTRQRCPNTRNLHVHHRWLTVSKAKRLGWLFFLCNIPLNLITLCKNCHEDVEGFDIDGDKKVGTATRYK